MTISGAASPTSAAIIDGKAVAARVTEQTRAFAARFRDQAGRAPGLAVVIVGEDPASKVYVASKGVAATECGFLSIQETLSAATSEDALEAVVKALNENQAVDGILVQLPLPDHIRAARIIAAIAPDKDVDGFHPLNVGRLGAGDLSDALVPCTPAGAMLLIESARGRDLSGLHAVVVGRSNIVGKPIAQLLLNANATVTIAHSRTADLAEVCRRADILVAAVGRPLMIKGDWIKPGATVIDVGINRVPAPERGEGKTRLVGDVDYAAARAVAGAITPVPGGVGPMTIAMLMANTLTAAHRRAHLPVPDWRVAP
ncbi:MAG: bifunctional methylenetetrahydrofolate dehydrogenase/methenyltetrahydrofolate cyclohydrolase [Rhizobiales bacterium 65-9]|nr:bifunctional methylenetetrahydrofolate dehydrogenase/methenyltetrahydrofolate cyclohydrolase FolD [Hyphomicrobiales bacterium]OJY38216.1 MAG: bifunctional methylenetetrahydrofolate dehydrogenase/methenyltetrahydrofolate cyclohydrolase [Rhizobiales bacterium 65-9]